MQQKENTVPIIEPVARELLLAELTPARKMRNTHRAGNEIYIFSAAECPSLMREVGRLREAAFRGAGGGTGQEVDIDEEDLAGDGYYQLIVWDPSAQEIVGGYRFIVCTTPNPRHLSTEHYFRFSERFRRKFLPRTIELGRSFVQPAYQARGNAKSIYALDNLWDGLGALIVLNPKAKYLFGKVTMYTTYKAVARNALIWFLRRYFPDRDQLVEGIHPIRLDLDDPYYEELFCGATYMENYRILGRALDVDVMRAAYTKQVHGTHVRTVTDADRCCPTDPDPCDSDGLVTNVRGLALFCFTADCVPLLLHDPVSEVAGAVHCGWRSSVGDIAAAAMRAMIKLGARARYTHAAIGPAIGACCFETDADVPEAVRRWLGDRDAAPFIREKGEGGKFLVDLRGALRCRLMQFGLEEKNIDVSDECTMCLHEKYWSHRYTHGARGSQCAVICL
jgi:YfiH family protein